MILDNQNQNLKVHEWIDQNISNGSLDIVTGYFTIRALAFLSDKRIRKYSEDTAVKNNWIKNITSNQFQELNYDYFSHEQIEIDKLVSEAYELNAEDVQEVENSYTRRYAKLSAAQKANLRAL